VIGAAHALIFGAGGHFLFTHVLTSIMKY